MGNSRQPDQDDPRFAQSPFGIFARRLAVRVLAPVAGVMVVLFLAAAWYTTAHSQTIYPGVTIAKVPVSQLTRDQAKARLSDWENQRQRTPVALRYAEYQRETTLAELGLKLDIDSAVEAAFGVGRIGSYPQRFNEILAALTVGHEISVRQYADQPALRTALRAIARDIDKEPLDGQLNLVGAAVVTFPPHAGRRLDVDATADRVLAALERDRPISIDLVVVDNIRPEIDEPQLQEAATRARRLLNGPLTFSFEGQKWEVTTEQIASFTRCEKTTVDNKPSLSVRLDPQGLSVLLNKIAGEIDTPAVEAKWQLVGNRVEVTAESNEGRKVDVAKTVAMAVETLETGEDREVALSVQQIKPELTTEDVKGWGIQELVTQAATDYVSGEERMHNIELAAQKLDGTIIRKGQTFCVNDALGKVSLETGYKQAYIIVAGQTVPGVGGGLCQIASTLFHAVFWGGYRIVERWPHEYHMPRYESTQGGVTYKGLDATIDAGVRFAFQNNGPSALLLRMSTDGQKLYVSLYGTKPKWEVSVSNYVIKNVRPSARRSIRKESAQLPADKEVQVEKATDGFDSYITRIVTDGGSIIDEYTVASSYRATDDVYLVGTSRPASAEAPADIGQPDTSNSPAN